MADKYICYIVVTADGSCPMAFITIEEAERFRDGWDVSFPEYSPHRVLRMEEVS